MIDLVYIRYESNFEDFCVNLYNKTQQYGVVDVYIVEHMVLEAQQKHMIELFCEPKYITPQELMELHAKSPAPVDLSEHENMLHGQQHTFTGNHAIVVYVYYTMFLREICSYINNFRSAVECDVYFYICETSGGHEIVERINSYLESPVNVNYDYVPNNGRDVRSFLQFVQSKQYTQYSRICKIHTKKTTYLHDTWRSEYCKQLLNIENFKNNIERDTRSSIYPVKQFSISEIYKNSNANYLSIHNLSNILKLNLPTGAKIQYNAGTMFWCTGHYCTNLYKLIKSIDLNTMFEPEPIPPDGTMAHAWERAFWVL